MTFKGILPRHDQSQLGKVRAVEVRVVGDQRSDLQGVRSNEKVGEDSPRLAPARPLAPKDVFGIGLSGTPPDRRPEVPGDNDARFGHKTLHVLETATGIAEKLGVHDR
jgi:hypothetical protein